MRGAVPHAALAVLVAAVIVQLPIYEFVKLHRRSDQQLREHFDLPAACEPSVTAGRSARSDVVVVITCRDAADDGRDAIVLRAPPRARELADAP